MTSPIRAIIVDDHPLYRGGVVQTLQSEPDIVVAGQAASTDEAIDLVTTECPDVALIDISMPGDGHMAVAHLKQLCPALRVAMLTASEDHDDVTRALSNGADGYILKGIGGSELVTVVRSLANGEAYVSPTLAGRLLATKRTGDKPKADLLKSLTHREEEIFRRVALGMTNREIAGDLGLQEKTIKHYMTLILQKLQVRNRTEAALMARKGLDIG